MSKCALMHPPYGRCKNACGALSFQYGKTKKRKDIFLIYYEKKEKTRINLLSKILTFLIKY